MEQHCSRHFFGQFTNCECTTDWLERGARYCNRDCCRCRSFSSRARERRKPGRAPSPVPRISPTTQCVVFSLRLLVSETIFNFTRSWRGSRIAFDYPSLPLRLKLCKPEKHTLWPKTTQTCRKFIPLKRHSLYGKGRCCCSLDKTRCEPLVKLLFTS